MHQLTGYCPRKEAMLQHDSQPWAERIKSMKVDGQKPSFFMVYSAEVNTFPFESSTWAQALVWCTAANRFVTQVTISADGAVVIHTVLNRTGAKLCAFCHGLTTVDGSCELECEALLD
jgi:hypothetical protein